MNDMPQTWAMVAMAVSAGPVEVLIRLAWLVPLYICCVYIPLGAFIYGAYYLVSIPLRRQERGRFFLDLLETALNKGGAVEQQLISISASHDPAPGARFQQFAAHLARGARISIALELVPRYLPPRVAAMLKTGEQLGDLSKVLPACRRLTQDAVSQTRSGAHYLCVLVFIVTPLVMLILASLITFIVPKFREIFAAMSETTWPMFDALLAAQGWILLAELFIIGATLAAVFFYVGGPRANALAQGVLPSVADWFALQVPWKRKRLQRDFASMLAILLDSGVPEPTAVQLAAESTANEVFSRRARRVVQQLAGGVKLTEAVAALDQSGEFRWRLTNARPAHGGFVSALNGWCETLDAKAFQQEQAAAQIATSGLVLFNGTIVAFIAIACFGALVQLVKEGTLW